MALYETALALNLWTQLVPAVEGQRVDEDCEFERTAWCIDDNFTPLDVRDGIVDEDWPGNTEDFYGYELSPGQITWLNTGGRGGEAQLAFATAPVSYVPFPVPAIEGRFG